MLKSIICTFLVFQSMLEITISIKDKISMCLCSNPNDPPDEDFQNMIGSREIKIPVPFQVKLSFSGDALKHKYNIYPIDAYCSGVIINEKWILTTGKCLESNDLQSLNGKPYAKKRKEDIKVSIGILKRFFLKEVLKMIKLISSFFFTY